MSMPALPVVIVSLVIFLILQTLVWRCWPREGLRLGCFGVLALAAYGGTVLMMHRTGWLAWQDHMWASAPMFSFCMTVYLLLYGVLCRSVSLRVVEELCRSQGRSMNLKALQAAYPYRFMLESRLSALTRGQLVSEQGGRFMPTERGAKLAALMVQLKRLYRLKVSG